MSFVALRTGQSILSVAVPLALFLTAPLASQTVIRDNEPLLADVGGTRIGRLAQGAAVASGPSRSGHTQITLEGWIFGQSLEPSRREGFTLQIARDPEENVRAEPNGRIIARLVRGAVLNEVERRGGWVRVRRTAWVNSAGIGQQAAARPVPAPSAPSTPQRSDAATAFPAPDSVAPADPRRAVVRRRLNLFRAPDSTAIGTLEGGHPVRIVARAGEWVRIETQAWVRENEIRLSDAGILAGVTASELRSAPEEYRGRLLRWTIQFLSLQTADELRSDFVPGQKYILARGPAPEYAFVYIVVPPALLPQVERLEALASVNLVARVRNGRSAFLANPILELVELL